MALSPHTRARRAAAPARPLIETLEDRTLLADFTLQILHASDLEAGVPALDDAPRFSSVLNALKDDYPNTVVLSSGDNWIPSPFYTAGADPTLASLLGTPDKGRGDMAIINALGFQAAAFGNHEFDEGTARVRSILVAGGGYEGANFPYLSSNLNFGPNADLGNLVVPDGQEASANKGKIAKSAVLTVNGEKIGLVGITTPLLPTISSPGTVVTSPSPVSEPLTPANLTALAAVVQPSIDALTAAGITKIIVLSHLQNLNNEIALAPLLKDVDLIVGGGSNAILADANDRLRAGDSAFGVYPLVVDTTKTGGAPMKTYIVNTDGNYQYVGRLVATFNDQGDIIPGSVDAAVSGAYATDAQGVTDTGSVAPTPRVTQITDALRAVISVKDGRTFGKTAVYLNGERAGVRTQETNFGNLTADANLAVAKTIDPTVTLSLKNGGGIRDAIGEIDPATGARIPPQANAFKGAGEVSQLDIENSLRFNNGLSLITVTASQLKALMEHGVAAAGQQGRYPQIGGFSFAYDANRPVGSRVVSLAVRGADGQVLDTVVRDGQIVGDPARAFRMVTLGFLATGGDGYPFPSGPAANLVNLIPAGTTVTFDTFGGEQRALADYFAANFATTPFKAADLAQGLDARIQNLAFRSDTALAGPASPAGAVSLSKLGTYTTGVFNAGGAEISAYDPASKRLFVVSASAGVDVLDLSNPKSPTKLFTISVTPFGAQANSVAVKNGVVAVAVEAAIKQNPGQVVFFNANGDVLKAVTVGALPDMLTFSPDGKWVLVANEGEPNSYGQAGSVDPEGSVSVIDLRSGVAGATVATAGFAAFNVGGPRNGELDPAVRIFGPGATVAQDLEPEYVTISADSTIAYVTLQENNALAVIDIATATVTAIKPLGFQYHGGELESFTFTDLPVLGTTTAGQDILLGGFSGLHYEGVNPANGNLKFLTHTDRGPNPEPRNVDGDAEAERPFALPAFQPELVRFELKRATGVLTLVERIKLKRADGTPLTGLPNTRPGNNGNLPFNDEEPVDLFGQPLALDPFGADLEGIAVAADGTFWMADEYRPALYHFATDGTLIERLVPQGTAAAAGLPAGTFGTESLPAILGNRRANRGFEGIAIQGSKIYAFVQSTIRNPDTLTNAQLNALRNVRVVEFDPATGATRQFLYVQDAGSDKIGDAVATAVPGQFLVMERDDLTGPAAAKNVYRINLAGATDVSALGVINGKTVDQMTAAELTAAGVVPLAKTAVVDLAEIGYNTTDKAEGLTLIDGHTLAVINDNDFRVAGTFDPATGTLDLNTKPIVLGLITLSGGLDASDRDNKINIVNQPVFGMYQPDAIATFVVGGQTYLVTANEGDARDYTGFAEEVRVGSLTLDPNSFPDSDAVKANANLGRLNVTRALGDAGNDGDFERLYVFGTRSFSIWRADGTLVYDSGDEFESITAHFLPAFFNASNADNAFDSRSDNKGPEPEGVTVGVVGGRTYAFIVLERVGGIMVYDVSDPASPKFVEYVNNRDFTAALNSPEAGDLGPEGVVFVPASESPTGSALVIVTNEISGTVTIFQVNEPNRTIDVGAAASTVLRRNGDDVELIDAGTGAVIFSQPLAQTESLTVNGMNGRADTLTVDFAAGGSFALTGGLAFAGGTGADTFAAVGTDAAETFRLAGAQAAVGGIVAALAGVEQVVFQGGAGNDTYVFATARMALRVIDTAGVDTLDFSGSASGLILNLGLTGVTQAINAGLNRLLLTGTVENVIGTAFGDVVRGNAAANRIEGGGGNDILYGLGGDDELLGGAGDDLLDGGEGNDIVLGGAGRDTLLGAGGRDLLFGGLGRDQLLGGAGDDLLFGASVTFEADWPALRAARDEWASARSYDVRVQNLRDGSGSADRLNGTAFLTEATVTDDGEQDILIGGPDRDWFWADLADVLAGRLPDERRR